MATRKKKQVRSSKAGASKKVSVSKIAHSQSTSDVLLDQPRFAAAAPGDHVIVFDVTVEGATKQVGRTIRERFPDAIILSDGSAYDLHGSGTRVAHFSLGSGLILSVEPAGKKSSSDMSMPATDLRPEQVAVLIKLRKLPLDQACDKWQQLLGDV